MQFSSYPLQTSIVNLLFNIRLRSKEQEPHTEVMRIKKKRGGGT